MGTGPGWLPRSTQSFKAQVSVGCPPTPACPDSRSAEMRDWDGLPVNRANFGPGCRLPSIPVFTPSTIDFGIEPPTTFVHQDLGYTLTGRACPADRQPTLTSLLNGWAWVVVGVGVTVAQGGGFPPTPPPPAAAHHQQQQHTPIHPSLPSLLLQNGSRVGRSPHR